MDPINIILALLYLLIIATPVILLALLASGKTKAWFFWFYLVPTILLTLLMTSTLFELHECYDVFCGLGSAMFIGIAFFHQLITFLTISIRRKFFSSKKNKKILNNQLRISLVLSIAIFLVYIFVNKLFN